MWHVSIVRSGEEEAWWRPVCLAFNRYDSCYISTCTKPKRNILLLGHTFDGQWVLRRDRRCWGIRELSARLLKTEVQKNASGSSTLTTLTGNAVMPQPLPSFTRRTAFKKWEYEIRGSIGRIITGSIGFQNILVEGYNQSSTTTDRAGLSFLFGRVLCGLVSEFVWSTTPSKRHKAPVAIPSRRPNVAAIVTQTTTCELILRWLQ